MYSIDLAQIALDEFEELLRNTNLTPGRRILLTDLSGVMSRLKQAGITDMAGLQKLLKNKKQYPALAAQFQVDTDYLTVLNREANSYAAKSVPLNKWDVFSASELAQLAAAGIKTSQDLYETCLTPSTRQALAECLHLPPGKLRAALELSDLVRINGVGPVYAQILREIGIHRIGDYMNTPSDEILTRYLNLAAEKGYPKISLKDVEYCKRFCRKLTSEIEW